MLTLRTVALALLAMLTVDAQNVTSPPATLNLSNNLTAVDYSTTISAVTQYFFSGENIDYKDSGLAAATVGTYGVRATRNFLGVSDYAPTTTVSAYLAAMAGGCTAGSVCDPSAWNWSNTHREEFITASRAQGNKIILCILYTPTWNSSDGTIFGLPANFAVWNDLVAKGLQHDKPDYVEIYNEPDYALDIRGSSYSTTQTAYFNMYQNAASAIRAVAPSVPIGGPVICCSDPSTWIPQFLTTRIISSGLINFVSYHNYQKSNSELFYGYNVPQLVQQNKPGIPTYITEWNAASPCDSDTLNDGDGNPATVPFWGMRLVNMLNLGITLANYWALHHDTYCSYVTNSAINLKARTMELMSVVLGMGAGNFSVMRSVNSGATASLGAINSNGQHVAVIVNYSNSPLVQAVTLNNTGFVTDKTWDTYIASTLSQPSTPTETVTVTPSAGSVTHTISIPANSVAGILVQ